MSKIAFAMAVGAYDLMRELRMSTLHPDGINLTIFNVPVINIFYYILFNRT